jgi:hypothetical protein
MIGFNSLIMKDNETRAVTVRTHLFTMFLDLLQDRRLVPAIFIFTLAVVVWALGNAFTAFTLTGLMFIALINSYLAVSSDATARKKSEKNWLMLWKRQKPAIPFLPFIMAERHMK